MLVAPEENGNIDLKFRLWLLQRCGGTLINLVLVIVYMFIVVCYKEYKDNR